ncbi:hypothetical protein MSAN_02264100 [Mycena sanguinolenta]|uniref:DUF6534 domain-containing protein n=1 Tax=Mycena sanguinolenta TaxID=230812 RepID=A0A8H6X9X8_9AGAR|nr:hypothetical protein MSAN_02264100 [Mycena sanguinolenta]
MIAYGVDSPLILGVMEIGVFLSLMLFGVVAFQGYLYFRNCLADTVGLRVLVGSILIFELCHSVASCHVIYYFTVVLAGVPELQKPSNSYSLSSLPLFETLITSVVQGFFAYRIWILSSRIYISLICWGLGFLRLLGGMAMAAVAFLDVPLEPNYFHVQNTYGWVITSALNVGAVLDVLIAVSLCVYIPKLYTPYNLPRSEELIHRLVTFTIQTGLITSLTSVAVVIAFQTMKHNFIWLALYTFLANLYSNSLLVALNARPQNRVRVQGGPPKSWNVAPPRSPNLIIEITRTIVDDDRSVACQEQYLQVSEKTVCNKTSLDLV